MMDLNEEVCIQSDAINKL